jgi:hypothetical protein
MRSVDPNYGARAVAMYKLDKLLNAGVTARAEFATHVDENGKTVLGTVLESAKGVQGGEAKYALNDERAAQNGGISLEDPVLQKSLSKLQILDAICGQLDRHANNYYIQLDAKGNVTGITGIDLDMAFGQDMDAPDSRTANFAHNYKGFPGAVDEEFAKVLLRIDAKDIEEAITGLLKPAEVAATVKRFTWVQNKVRELQQNDKLVKEWGVKTVFEGAGYKLFKDTDFSSGAKNYQDSLLSYAGKDLKESSRSLIASVLSTGSGPAPFNAGIAARTLEELPSETLMLFDRHMNAGSTTSAEIANWLYNNRMPERLEEFTMLVLNEAFRDTKLMDRFIVAVQELGEGVGSAGWTNDFQKAASKEWVPAAAKKLKAVKPSESAQKQGRKSLLGSSRGKR